VVNLKSGKIIPQLMIRSRFARNADGFAEIGYGQSRHQGVGASSVVRLSRSEASSVPVQIRGK
jgi:hypothetical protein